ncbi:hypothetical protein MESS2_1690006 [Mesorhizobium metallidurans STM 2683]|uniref:Uncharacterized protein n=1 Tax=Mesorhizobium metallidurans STM 2683 TaxID=1297569 RepID=M5ENZ3_9HYPH|nr:hypothetical protein MESS2_1690006 [Mesorhizobium metallidurans STM 2683]
MASNHSAAPGTDKPGQTETPADQPTSRMSLVLMHSLPLAGRPMWTRLSDFECYASLRSRIILKRS